MMAGVSTDFLLLLVASHFCYVSAIVTVALLLAWLFSNKPYVCYGILVIAIIKCLIPPINIGWIRHEVVLSDVNVPEVAATTSENSAPGNVGTNPDPILPQQDSQANASPSKQSGIGQSPLSNRFSNLPPIQRVPLESPKVDVPRKPEPVSLKETAILTAGGIYILVASMFFLGVAFSIFRFNRLVFKASLEQIPINVANIFNGCKEVLGIRNARLVLVDREIGPLATGFFRPKVIVPAEVIASASKDDLRTIFLHELNHHKRMDVLLGWLQTIAVCLWWFHPLIWILSSQLSRWREYCCDLETITSSNLTPKQYCLCLLNLSTRKESFSFPFRLGTSGFMAFEKRISVLMSNKGKRFLGMPGPLKMGLLTIVLLLLPNVVGFHYKDLVLTPKENEKVVVYYSGKQGVVELGADRKTKKTPFKTVSNVSHGSVSPDGRSFAYVAWHKKERRVWVSTRDGVNTSVSPDHGQNFIRQIAWSPDGSQLAYRTDNGHLTAVYVCDSDGQNRRKLKPYDGEFSRGVEYYHEFCWAPDGKSLWIAKVLEITTNHYGSMITTKRSSVLSQHFLANDKRREFTSIGGRREMSNLSCSPDGQWIAFKSNGKLMIQGTKKVGLPIDLASPVNPDGYPKWSDNSRSVLAHSSTRTSPSLPNQPARNRNQSYLLKVGLKKTVEKIPVEGEVWDYAWDEPNKAVLYTNSLRKLTQVQFPTLQKRVLADDVGFWSNIQVRKTINEGK